MGDLKSIHRDWQEVAQRFAASAAGAAAIRQVTADRGRLLYGADAVFQRGHDVVVTSNVTGEDFFGMITNITQGEVSMRLVDGSKSRVYLKHFRSNRCSMRRAS